MARGRTGRGGDILVVVVGFLAASLRLVLVMLALIVVALALVEVWLPVGIVGLVVISTLRRRRVA
jgi:hypothetical protein